jgi:hypothetical protein
MGDLSFENIKMVNGMLFQGIILMNQQEYTKLFIMVIVTSKL